MQMPIEIIKNLLQFWRGEKGERAFKS